MVLRQHLLHHKPFRMSTDSINTSTFFITRHFCRSWYFVISKIRIDHHSVFQNYLLIYEEQYLAEENFSCTLTISGFIGVPQSAAKICFKL